MSEIFNHVQNLSTLSFEEARSGVAYAGIAAGALFLGAFGADYLRSPKSAFEGAQGVDIDLINDVVHEETNGKFGSRVKRWGAPLLFGVGVSVASVNLLDPQLEYSITVPDTETIFVIDSSLSMQNTEDMDGGQTRQSVVSEALITSSKDFPRDMKVGIVLFGANSELTTPLTTDRSLLMSATTVPETIQADGGALAEGIGLAQNILEGSENNGTETMFIVTDGTVDNPEKVSTKLRNIADNGTKVVLLMPGTKTGSYTRTEFDQVPIKSGVNTVAFSNLEKGVTMLETTSKDEISELIEETVDQQSRMQEKRPTQMFFLIGGILIGLSGLLNARNIWKRK